MISEIEHMTDRAVMLLQSWVKDWNKFAYEALGARLDKEQQAILDSVQYNPLTSVVSGTSRGKDHVAAVASLSFLYLTPGWSKEGQLIENTKVILTAPTNRQVRKVMMPEVSRMFHRAVSNGVALPGILNSCDIRTPHEEWFLLGFKASDNNHEAWSGIHAANIMFVATEASGINDDTFGAIEGNLQGNSRLLLVFNFNRKTGYAADSQKNERFKKFRLNSLYAPNVLEKRIVIPGQVDYDWLREKVNIWCLPIGKSQVESKMDDFEFEGVWYRPSDIFRIKILGRPPQASEDQLIPEQWIEEAEERWKEKVRYYRKGCLRLGVDVAGMGSDDTVYCYRFGNWVEKIDKKNSGGEADHMATAGDIRFILNSNGASMALIDTIGEGAGVYSALKSEDIKGAISCKNSESARDKYGQHLTDVTGQRKFGNMRAYLYWAVRDWLDPRNGMNAMLPPGGTLKREACEIRWKHASTGLIMIEPKEELKKRLGFSPNEFDALANTFYPEDKVIQGNLFGNEDIKTE